MKDKIKIRLKRNSNFLDIEKLSARTSNKTREVELQIPNSLAISGGFGMEGEGTKPAFNNRRIKYD